MCGLTTAQIARAFLLPETTVAQRITRAKRKITDAGIPYRIPASDELGDRLAGVLAVIYLLFNEGYLSTAARPHSRDLTDDAEWLAGLLHRLMPTEPEVAGLLALIQLHRARVAARFDGEDGLVLLAEQDRSLWDRAAIAEATGLLTRAARQHRPGPYQLQAAIVACHAEAERWEDTDWAQIVLLYDMLLYLAPSPVTRLHRAIALRYTDGPRAAMAELDDAGRPAGRAPPLPRHQGRAAARARPPDRARRRRPAGAGADRQSGRARAAAPPHHLAVGQGSRRAGPGRCGRAGGRRPGRAGRRTAAVFPVELGRAVVADQMPDAGDVAGVGDQQRAGLLEPDALLELQRAHRRDGAEVPVERGRAHPGQPGESAIRMGSA